MIHAKMSEQQMSLRSLQLDQKMLKKSTRKIFKKFERTPPEIGQHESQKYVWAPFYTTLSYSETIYQQNKPN